MIDKPKESDWKAFSRLVPIARERYLTKVNASLAELLQSDEGTPTERFWEAEEKLQDEVLVLRTCLDSYSRSKMFVSLRLMMRHRMVTGEDLGEFSEEFREEVLSNWEL